MRPIKFRQFIGGKIVYWGFIEGAFFGPSANGATDENAQNTPQMQFTGLLDKNGKEIYEGDIVVKDGYIWFLDNGKPNYRGTVEWYYSAWNVSVTCVNKDSHGSATGCGFNDNGLEEGSKSDWEIIGNIYENPDLINA